MENSNSVGKRESQQLQKLQCSNNIGKVIKRLTFKVVLPTMGPQFTRGEDLVVDDEPATLRLLSQILTTAGHEVETVDNTSDALEKINSERYNLILLDIKLPGTSGVELYNSIQKIAQSLARRVVFITGDVMGIDTKNFLSQAKAPYITKPFNIEQLKRDISRLLIQPLSASKKH